MVFQGGWTFQCDFQSHSSNDNIRYHRYPYGKSVDAKQQQFPLLHQLIDIGQHGKQCFHAALQCVLPKSSSPSKCVIDNYIKYYI